MKWFQISFITSARKLIPILTNYVDDALLICGWCTFYMWMMHFARWMMQFSYVDDALVLCGWCTFDMWMMHFWYVDDTVLICGWCTFDMWMMHFAMWMMHFWYVDDALVLCGWCTFGMWMMHFWYVDDALLLCGWCNKFICGFSPVVKRNFPERIGMLTCRLPAIYGCVVSMQARTAIAIGCVASMILGRHWYLIKNNLGIIFLSYRRLTSLPKIRRK